MPGFWRKCRIGFRWFRLTIWVIVLAGLCAFFWFNRVGLPDFLKTRLVATLRDQGVDLEFSRLRLRLVRGIVAENVRVSQTRVTDGPGLSAREVQVRVDFTALLHREVQVDGLIVTDGVFTWPLTPEFALTATNLQVDLRFGPTGTWTLDHGLATVNGTRISVSAEIGHAIELRNWDWFRGQAAGNSPDQLARLEQIAATLKKIQLPGLPRVALVVNGDARDARSFNLHLNASIPDALTPWGRFQKTDLTADARLVSADSWPQLNLRLTADEAVTPWGKLAQGLLTLQSAAVPAPQLPPLTIHLEAAALGHQRYHLANLLVDAQLTTNALSVARADTGLAWWTNLQPFQLTWQTHADQLAVPGLVTHDLVCNGNWRFPQLAVTRLSVSGGGNLSASAKLDVATRELVFTNDVHLDPHTLASLLPPSAQNALEEITWTQLPWVYGEGRLQLPAWTQPLADWPTEVPPTLTLQGEVAFTNALAGPAQLDLVRAHYVWTNQVLRLPDLHLAAARSQLDLNLAADTHTQQLTTGLHGMFDPAFLLPFFKDTNAVDGFKICAFTEPVALDATVQAGLNNWQALSVTGHLALTNFTVRGQWIDSVASAFDYSNRIANFYAPRMWRAGGAQTATADQVVLDLNRMWIQFTNGYSTAEAQVIARAIGPKTAHIVAPYQFLAPPTARVNGGVALRENDAGHVDADLIFEIIQPAPFRWENLQSPQVTGTIHWMGQTLLLTNIVSKFYEGDGQGWAYFDFRPVHPGADYQFDFTTTNSNLHLLALDVISPTNHLEGSLAGRLVITNASTENLQSWRGYGHAHLRDGLLWDIPVFGIISPVLNKVSPGLGNNRATEATANFIITNGVISTDSLVIRSAMSRLEYRGTADFNQNVDARVTLEMLRNTPVVGVVISNLLRPVSKAFEYRVTGSFDNPKTTPVFVPEILLLPLHPIRTMEDLLTPAGTNAPAH